MSTQLTLDLGIDATIGVRDLIIHGDIEQETAPKAKREQPSPTWECVLSDSADCAFRRRCGNRSQLLVMLVTQGQYYVTDERTGSRHQLTTARLGTFCKGATGGALTPPWSRSALQDYDAKGRAAVVALLGCGDFREMCKRDMVRMEAWAASRMGANAKCEPERRVGAGQPRVEARGADHGTQPQQGGSQRGAPPLQLLWRGARRGVRRVLPRQALRLEVCGGAWPRRDARPTAQVPRQERRAPEGRHRRLPPPPRVRHALHGVEGRLLRAAPRVRVRALPARPPRTAPPHPLLQRPAVG